MAIEIVLPALDHSQWLAGFVLSAFAIFFGVMTAWAIQERSWGALILGAFTIFLIFGILLIWEMVELTFV